MIDGALSRYQILFFGALFLLILTQIHEGSSDAIAVIYWSSWGTERLRNWVLETVLEHSYSLRCCPQNVAFLCPFSAQRPRSTRAVSSHSPHQALKLLPSDPSHHHSSHSPSAWALLLLKSSFCLAPRKSHLCSPSAPCSPDLLSSAPSLLSLAFQALPESWLSGTEHSGEHEWRSCEGGHASAQAQTLCGNWEMSFKLSWPQFRDHSSVGLHLNFFKLVNYCSLKW